MSTKSSVKTGTHLSPTVGLTDCEANARACKYQHFSDEAVARIKAGEPRDYSEHEAMMIHDEARRVARIGKTVTKPVARPAASAPTTQRASANGFPQGHRERRPRYGDERLFHAEIGFPKNFTPPNRTVRLAYSNHAQGARMDDRYGVIPELERVNLGKMDLIEMGVQDGRVSKFVYRTELDDDFDMCIVVMPAQGNSAWTVKTVWLNEKTDTHRTLNRSRYTDPAQMVAQKRPA